MFNKALFLKERVDLGLMMLKGWLLWSKVKVVYLITNMHTEAMHIEFIYNDVQECECVCRPHSKHK